MNLTFNKIILHNFGSYNHAEVDLTNRGFCLVSGQNNCKKDNALSNGSGKSFLWSAICFALTSETIGGLKKNLKNINNDEPNCYVTLDFKVDKDTYSINRIVAPASDLKIIKNDIDVSGKGITESKKKLEELLPDLTKDLIAATIILGQGMPNKFSSFTPAGRKELLEKLTKSDFMIEDVKNRLATRASVVNAQLREYEDNLLINYTQLTTATNELAKYEVSLAKFVRPDYDSEIIATRNHLTQILNNIDIINKNIEYYEQEIEKQNNTVLDLTTQKNNEGTIITESYSEKLNSLTVLKAQTQAEINALDREIVRLKSVTDICPTCGQKLVGVEKPDTAKQEQEKLEKTTKVSELTKAIDAINAEKFEKHLAINEKYEQSINDTKAVLADLRNKLLAEKSNLSTHTTYKNNDETNLTKLEYGKNNIDKYYNDLVESIKNLKITIENLNKTIKLITDAKEALTENAGVLKKMDTLVKRDFRSYLLTNIINFINSRAKDYCEIVFETRDLEIYIDGNALDISYCGKMFDNLSGGEKQRIDLIIQFTIRDMLNTYLNYSSNILVLDEIFDNLDRVATDKILNLISEKLKDIESIFIISHHADSLSISYDTELTIIKNENGISEVY